MDQARSRTIAAHVAICAMAVSISSFTFAADKPAAGGAAGFKAMDADGDGRISPDEHAAGARKMFDGMDANKDGKVTAAEMDAAHEKMTGKKAGPKDLSSVEKIKVVDQDGDGVLTTAEHTSGSKMMFDKTDADRDGYLSQAEQAAAHSKMLSKQ